ncbi:MAG: diphthine--ammonia ligase [Gammaproteobacteria bacterium]
MTTVALAWSGGKDSLMALLALESTPGIEVNALVTTVTEPYRRISMHGVREVLLDAQARALGIELAKCRLPDAPDNETYRERFAATLHALIDTGIAGVAFGDLYLADVRAFREDQMQSLGLETRFPLWHKPTAGLAREFIENGYRAMVCCVDSEQLSPAFLGREYDVTLLKELPASVDPCGENGEFHTFVYDGPHFARRIGCDPGRTHIADERFHFLDLKP